MRLVDKVLGTVLASLPDRQNVLVNKLLFLYLQKLGLQALLQGNRLIDYFNDVRVHGFSRMCIFQDGQIP
jgi:hypothetical protein